MKDRMEHFEKWLTLGGMRELFRPDAITYVFPRGFYKLSEQDRAELKAGRCAYREYEGEPILDYTAA